MSSSSPVRVGVAGTSDFVARVHLPLLQSHPGATIVSLCGRSETRARDVAQRFGVPMVFTNYTSMLQAGNLDAVVVATPDDQHAAMTLAAVDAGLHVLCEKPLATTARDAREMWRRAQLAGVKHMTFFRWRWLSVYQRLHTLLAEGWVGKPLQWTFTYLSAGGWRPGYAWRFDERRATGTLGDLGSHMIDLAFWLGGDIAAVSGTLNTFGVRHREDGTQMHANDAAVLLLRFADGAQGLVQLSSVATLGRESQIQEVAVYGDAGHLAMHYARSVGPVLRGARRGEAVVTLDSDLRQPGDEGSDDDRVTAQWLEQPVADRLFIDAILRDRPVRPSLFDGARVQAVIESAIESSRTGAWVDVPVVD